MEQLDTDIDTKYNKILIQQELLLKDCLSLGFNLPIVKKVIRIACTLTDENRLITTELLSNIASRKLKIPRAGINKIIQNLLNNKFLIDGSRFTKLTILSNQTRFYIYQLIETYLGAHFSFLKKQVSQVKEKKIGTGCLTWHLDKLISFNLIKKVKVQNYLIFLPIKISDEEGILYFILRDPLNRLIVNLLLERETVYKVDFYKELNVKRAKMYYRIKNLIELGIISPLNDNEKAVFINLDKKDLITEIIFNILHTKRIENMTKLISIKN